jgi:hypothetical protein
MSIYTIKNTETDEVFEINMKFIELEQYLEANPHFKQIYLKFPSIGDSIRLGKKKPDDGFKDVLKTVQQHHRRNNINSW